MLAGLLDVRGVRHVLLVGSDGQIVSSAGLEGTQAAAELGLVAAGKAVMSALQQNLGSPSWNELLLDVDGGPVLLVPYGDQVMLTAFDDVASLGRVRFAVRRLLGTA